MVKYIIVVGLLLFGQSLDAQTINNAQSLIQTMHDRYAKVYYKSVTFDQKTVTHQADGSTKVELWHEYIKLPGKLRIDIEPLDSGRTMIFLNDSLFALEHGKVKNSLRLIHSLVLLGFDVYAQPVEVTMGKLKELGYDFSQFHEDVWQGKPVYVVGAPKGDLHSKQFWVEKERLLFVRSLEPGRRNPNATSEVQFNKYQKLANGWIETEVLFLSNGKLLTEELYSNIKANQQIDDGRFKAN